MAIVEKYKKMKYYVKIPQRDHRHHNIDPLPQLPSKIYENKQEIMKRDSSFTLGRDLQSDFEFKTSDY